ncbi:MAG: D-2-hydroxyacid dehydrogenase [Candidatus Tectomicrobia bacterium]|uniref:D-2-hydroxyacid dehydrogenase n=1 Tax=Tectimicrobiota bacterium TaxID=2528274 RepID=A0A932FXU5_UNCTE|nr:D-2-hydroxyacid dehydrogenase [Candidatus Tectomicrobia bacterium]
MRKVRIQISLYPPKFLPTFPPYPEACAQRIREEFPGTEVVLAKSEEEHRQGLPEAEVLFTWRPSGQDIRQAGCLRWVHVPSAGVDHSLPRDLVESPVVLTNSSGLHGVPIAENVLGMMIVLARKLHDCMRFQMEGRWGRNELMRTYPTLSELYGRTAGIVGLGSIGREIARRAKAFGMRILATKRDVGVDLGSNQDWVDRLLPPEGLPELLRESDFVVIATPLTPATRGLIGEAELRMMKPTAFLFNIGRGPIIQEAILVQALKEGWIAGAGLDVFEVEPLPAESELYRLPNVLVTPHYSGIGSGYWERGTDLFCANLGRFLRGERLTNLVNKEAGY